MAGTAAGVRRWQLLVAVPAAVLGISVAWRLAGAGNTEPSSILRVFADGLGAAVLGLAALRRLESKPRKLVAQQALWRDVAVLASVWVVAELLLLFFTAADVANTSPARLGGAGLERFLVEVTAGRVGLAVIGCTLFVVWFAAIGYRRPAPLAPDAAIAVAALALVFRPITGHMSTQTLGPVFGAIHALAAAVWFGLLVAMAIELRSRGEWAATLPRYSQVALWCVAVLTVSGVVNSVVRLDRLGAFFDTGYGRIVVAKLVVLSGLVALGWWWRRSWVGEAANHRATADDSLRRAIIEVAAMAVAFGLAGALATTA